MKKIRPKCTAFTNPEHMVLIVLNGEILSPEVYDLRTYGIGAFAAGVKHLVVESLLLNVDLERTDVLQIVLPQGERRVYRFLDQKDGVKAGTVISLDR